MTTRTRCLLSFLLGAALSLGGLAVWSAGGVAEEMQSAREVSTRALLSRFDGALPATATEVYYYAVGFVDREEFLAVTVPEAELWRAAEALAGVPRDRFAPPDGAAVAALRTPTAAGARRAEWWTVPPPDGLLLCETEPGYVVVAPASRRIFVRR